MKLVGPVINEIAHLSRLKGHAINRPSGPARQHMVNLLRQVFVVGVEQVFTLQQHAQSHSLMHKHTIRAQNFHDRHPRFLARVRPTQLALWSFLAALAHGAGLMLVPIYLGICQTIDTDAGHAAASVLMTSNPTVALGVALLHSLAMLTAGGTLAFGVYRWLGLKFLSKGWFNLDLVWALSLIFVGVIALVMA
jgi:hypothetical protein